MKRLFILSIFFLTFIIFSSVGYAAVYNENNASQTVWNISLNTYYDWNFSADTRMNGLDGNGTHFLTTSSNNIWRYDYAGNNISIQVVGGVTTGFEGLTLNRSNITWVYVLRDWADTEEVLQYFWNESDDRLYNMSWSFSIQQTTHPTGIAFNETYFWIIDADTGMVYRYNESGHYNQSSFNTTPQGTGWSGLTFNGTHFWITKSDQDRAFLYDVNGNYENEYFGFGDMEIAHDIFQEYDNSTVLWIPNFGSPYRIFRYDLTLNTSNSTFYIPLPKYSTINEARLNLTGYDWTINNNTPNNTWVDVANSGSPYEFSYAGSHHNITSEVDLDTDIIQSFLSTCSENATDWCDLPITVGALTEGYEQISDIYIDTWGGLNITVYNEQNLTQLIFNVTVQTDTFYETQENINNYSNQNIGGNITVSVSSQGYQSRNYYFDISPNEFYNLTAYLLANESGVDVNYFIYSGRFPFGEPNAIITALRNINSEWTIVEEHQSDDVGTGSIFLQPEIIYRINAESADGSLYRNISIYYPDGTETLNINLLGTAVKQPGYWNYYRQFTGECGFDNATRLLTCTWEDGSGLMNYVDVRVDIVNTTGQFNLCLNSSTETTGSVYCNFGTMRNYTYMWSMKASFIDPESLLIDSGSWTDYVLPIALGITGIIIAMLIVIFSGFIGVQLGSPVMTVLMTMIGVGASVILGLLSFGSGILTMIIGFFIAGLVLIYKLRA